MAAAPDSLVGRSIEWPGVHHSQHGDFSELSTHVVSYEAENKCYATAGGKVVGEASYTYARPDERMAILIYRPALYQGRTDVTLYAMLDFAQHSDRAVILAGGEPFAIADGEMREVATPPRA
jgi:hypothetical protein